MSHSTMQTLLVKTLFVAALAVGFLTFARPIITGAKDPNKQPEKTDSIQKTAVANPTALGEQIDASIDKSEFANARWGVYVISLADGAVVYQRNADKLFTPASNMKIYTTGVALNLLGADYRWRTSVYSNVQPDSAGELHSDLILYGRGAPDLVSLGKDDGKPSLSGLADQLYQKGIRRIDGNVIGDESYFRGDPYGEGWQWNDLQWYFGAEASSLSINENQIDINFVPGAKGEGSSEVRSSDAEGYVTVQNRMTAGQTTRSTIGVHRGLSDNNVEVWGEFAPGSKGFGARLSVFRPAMWAARLFTSALKRKGITIQGQTLSRDFRTPPTQRFDPASAIELAAIDSQPLSEIIRKTNKESNNLYAELILRTLGRERGEMVPVAKDPGIERGDAEAGLAVIRLWLGRLGVDSSHVALHDGCGLSRLDLVSPEVTARLLAELAKTPTGSVFQTSLPIAGRDGTLAGRLKPISDRVFAKTGSITYDNSLSGYVRTEDGEIFAFSILCNDQTGHDASTRVIDQIVESLATARRSDLVNPHKPQ